MSKRILNRKDLALETGLSRMTIERLERSGKFPRRLQLSTGRVGWLREDVEEWLASRKVGA
ncbi:MAG: AlpA family phage regulatory protein [Deltaproteobacteria bacterium]|nr:AlpA family phage regulatory protein [Deltaproteobacteria bacterium]